MTMNITTLQLRYRDWPINQTLDALEASFRRPAQPRHADTHKLIRFQLRWSPGPASDEERDASFKRSNCQQALTGNILVQAQGPSKYFIKFHEIHFFDSLKLYFAWNTKWHCDCVESKFCGILLIFKEFNSVLTRQFVRREKKTRKKSCEQSRQSVLSPSVWWAKVNRKEGRRLVTCPVPGRGLLA